MPKIDLKSTFQSLKPALPDLTVGEFGLSIPSATQGLCDSDEGAPVETDSTRMCELLVGLPDMSVDGVGDWPGWVRIAITERNPRPVCAGCGGGVHAHGRNDIVLVDLPVFGRAARRVRADLRGDDHRPVR